MAIHLLCICICIYQNLNLSFSQRFLVLFCLTPSYHHDNDDTEWLWWFCSSHLSKSYSHSAKGMGQQQWQWSKTTLHSKYGTKKKSAMLSKPFMPKIGCIKSKQLEQVRTIEKISFLLHHIVFKLGLHSRPNVSSWNPEPQAKGAGQPIKDVSYCDLWLNQIVKLTWKERWWSQSHWW